jgi:hypothetical protein
VTACSTSALRCSRDFLILDLILDLGTILAMRCAFPLQVPPCVIQPTGID